MSHSWTEILRMSVGFATLISHCCGDYGEHMIRQSLCQPKSLSDKDVQTLPIDLHWGNCMSKGTSFAGVKSLRFGGFSLAPA